MIHVVATLEVVPGKRADVLAEFARIVPLVRAEAGCHGYVPAIDVSTPHRAQPPVRPDTVVVVEKWADWPALDAHGRAAHMLDFRARTAGLVRSVTLQVLAPA